MPTEGARAQTHTLENLITHRSEKLTVRTYGPTDFALKAILSDKKSNSGTCADGCQMPFN